MSLPEAGRARLRLVDHEDRHLGRHVIEVHCIIVTFLHTLYFVDSTLWMNSALRVQVLHDTTLT